MEFTLSLWERVQGEGRMLTQCVLKWILSSPALLLHSTPLRVHMSVPLSRGENGVSAVGRQADPHRLEP